MEGNCGDQFQLDEFLWMVLITTGSIVFFFLNFVLAKFFIAAHCTFFFVTLANVLFFCEWRVLLEELTAEHGSG